MAKSGIKDKVVYPSFNGDGGDNGMEKYVTKAELIHAEQLLTEKIDHRSDVLEEKFNTTFTKIDSLNNTVKWLFGIIAFLFAVGLGKIFFY